MPTKYNTEGADTGSCRSCGATIFWVLKKGAKGVVKPHPVDPSGFSHFLSCPQSARWRGIRKKDADSGQRDFFAE